MTSRGARPLSTDLVWNCFLPFLFIIYPSISKTAILMLRCRIIDGNSFLLADLALSCETAEYRMAGPPSSEQLTESRPNSYSPCFFPPAGTARPLLEPSTPGCPARS